MPIPANVRILTAKGDVKSGWFAPFLYGVL